HLHPVATRTIRLQRGLERRIGQGAGHADLAAAGQPLAGRRRQHEEAPVGTGRLRRTQHARLEADVGCGGHDATLARRISRGAPMRWETLAPPRREIPAHMLVDVGVEPITGLGQALHLHHVHRARVAIVVAVDATVAEAHIDPARPAVVPDDARITVAALVAFHGRLRVFLQRTLMPPCTAWREGLEAKRSAGRHPQRASHSPTAAHRTGDFPWASWLAASGTTRGTTPAATAASSAKRPASVNG